MFKKLTEDGAPTLAPLRRPTGSASGSGMIWLDPALSGGSAGLVIEGTVRAQADLAVNGRIKGDVFVTRLTLDEGGVIEGSVTAEQADIQGRVIGDIRASVVRLHAKAVVEGDITAGKLAIDLGADFQGRCIRLPQPVQAPVVEATAAPHVEEDPAALAAARDAEAFTANGTLN